MVPGKSLKRRAYGKSKSSFLSKIGQKWATSAGDLDAGLFVREDFTNFYGGNPGLDQSLGEGVAIGSGDEETSGGLRIVEDGAKVFGDVRVIFHQAFGEGAVVVEASGDVSGVDAVEGAGKEWNISGVDLHGHIGGQEDFAGVANEAEAGDVGHGVDCERKVPRLAVAYAPARSG